MPQICIFEDIHHSQLTPLVYSRPVFELRCGLFSALERIIKGYPHTPVTLFVRNYLAQVLKEKYPYPVNATPAADDTCLFLNGRVIFPAPIPLEGLEEIGVQDNAVVYARLRGENIKKMSPEAFLTNNPVELFRGTVRVVNTRLPVINYFWDIVNLNKVQIEKDFAQFVGQGSVSGKRHEGVYLINEGRIFVGKGSRIKPACVLDAEQGPIYIGDNVTIASNTTIEGPVYIGDHCVVQSNSRIRGGANVGEVCKVGGEIVNVIFHGYSNKQHDGFLGDSYIGSWVNIGADTVNSNLLNTYGGIKVNFGGNVINTGLMFLGMAMGDHTKTAINTTIMTGSNFGFACNLVTPAYPPKYLPSFAWCSNRGIKVYTLEKALLVAKLAMKRRGKEMTSAEEEVFRIVFKLTETERNAMKNIKKQPAIPS